MGAVDVNPKRITTVGSVPKGTQPVGGASSPSVPANSSYNFQVTFIPQNQLLSIWNFLWSVYVDTNNSTYNWPTGANLSAAQSGNIQISDHIDWATSDDQLNTRIVLIRIVNNDSSPHTFYLKIKGYTAAEVA